MDNDLKPSIRPPPTNFEKRIELCWELYQLCQTLKLAPKTEGVKIFPKEVEDADKTSDKKSK